MEIKYEVVRYSDNQYGWKFYLANDTGEITPTAESRKNALSTVL